MALTTNNRNMVTLRPLSHASWSTVPTEGLPATVLQAVRDGSSINIFVLDASGPITLTYLNGPPNVTVPTACFATDTPITTNSQTIDSSGEVWYSMRDPAGADWTWYANQAGRVQSVTSPGTLAAFIS